MGEGVEFLYLVISINHAFTDQVTFGMVCSFAFHQSLPAHSLQLR